MYSFRNTQFNKQLGNKQFKKHTPKKNEKNMHFKSFILIFFCTITAKEFKTHYNTFMFLWHCVIKLGIFFWIHIINSNIIFFFIQWKNLWLILMASNLIVIWRPVCKWYASTLIIVIQNKYNRIFSREIYDNKKFTTKEIFRKLWYDWV